ncbi:AAA-domain-containing protein [Mollisia scopiformis]|uniref:Peroxisomal ATPase PEX6 n=1 Tax=Mollisia scopiformis TaxID=149040 RepID=A0A194WSW6_MOLSC|nr:AAA-domain-containing protein [Mollisia scopiformis]KUJ11050.1 AAA-domain-containing protein [Mollisia scopiformis]
MADRIPILPSRKRKRRRLDKSAISARLVLDDHVKGDVGILSEDLFADLFPTIADAHENGNGHSNLPEFHHVAISPWGPSALVEDSTWSVVPVRPSSALAHSTVQFSPSSLALQGFAEALQKVAPSKISSHSRSGIEIRILDIIPLPLETVFVTIEGELAKRLENGEGTFHAEHTRTNGLPNGKSTSQIPEDRLTAALREALGSLKVVHTGDLFSLPLPPHPITHIPPPPAKVTLCEPVGQGTLSGRTKIIITQTGHHDKGVKKSPALPVNRVLNGVQEDDEDTSNDQFYSAAEDRYKTDAAIEEDDTTETEDEQSEDNDDLSDDSMDDMISLHAPMLPAHNASGISTIQPGTPRTVGRGRRTDGINTPGSVFSTFTSATLRAGGPQGRLFKVQGLMQTLPEAMLHPKPSSDDDEEARVFVDITSLTKIGCFSGDWVRLEAASEPPPQGGGLWGLGSFGHVEQEDPLWRPVKVFGLPENYSHRPVTRIPSSKQGERRMSFFENQVKKPSSSTVYCSPILLANMENTPYCRIAPLKRGPQLMKIPQPKITGSSKPPFARELTLQKISTPFSTERTLQNALFAGLKQYFASRTRIVRKGDLIGIPIDQELGRTLYQPAGGDDLDIENLLSNSTIDDPRPSKPAKVTGVGWFKIGYVGIAKEDAESSEDDDFWGGVAAIDASSTHMMQSGSENRRLPATMESTWEYYLGLKSMSKSEVDSTSMPEPRKHHVSALQRRLRELIAAATSPRAIHLELQPLAILLVSTQRNIGKATMASRASADIGLHTFTIDAYDMVSEGGAGSDVKTAGLLEARAERAMACGSEFCSLLIRHIEALTADRMVTTLKEIVANARVVVATTTEVDKIPDGVRGLFTHELEMNAPDEWEREGILRGIIDEQPVALAPDVDLSAVAVKTAALVAGDLVDVVDRALVARNTRLEYLALSCSDAETSVAVRDVLVAGGPAGRCLTKADFELAVEAARKNFADAIGAPKIPNVSWDDVGGLTDVKDAVMETIQLPLERPELFAKGMKKRSGILFYGPPGTGKTLLAKAIATEFSLNFFSVKGPELLNMYIGESEANVRRVFQRARDARPCVVFFDELDSVAPKRGNQGDSGGVMDRIVSQLLAELDGMSDGEDGGGGVFVIGATNRPDLLDAALLRPGRFDKMLYLGVSDTHEKQLTIMEALTRKFTLHPSLSLPRVASRLPFTYTGADFYALCSDAMLKAVTRQASLVDSKIAQINNENIAAGKNKISTAYFFDHFAKEEDVAVMVTEEDFVEAERELIPSVSVKELEHYGKVRSMFEKVEEAEKGERQRSNGKGKGKEKVVDRKGKGKDRSAGRWDEGSDDEDKGFFDERVNGHGAKGKGKAVDMGFQQEGEDEDLY